MMVFRNDRECTKKKQSSMITQNLWVKQLWFFCSFCSQRRINTEHQVRNPGHCFEYGTKEEPAVTSYHHIPVTAKKERRGGLGERATHWREYLNICESGLWWYTCKLRWMNASKSFCCWVFGSLASISSSSLTVRSFCKTRDLSSSCSS